MTPQEFIARWKGNELTERAGAQAHFDDLCELLGVEKPRDPENYCFERGAKKAGGGDGWADVWKRGCFGWENKKPGRDLKAALKQLTDYAPNLDNPPLLVVCDREIIEIHTVFNGYPDEPRTIRLEDLADEGKRQMLRWVFDDPEKLRPQKSTAAITMDVAGHYADLAKAMRQRGEDEQKVAHFLMQCLFAMFSEDEEILPDKLFTKLLERFGKDPVKARESIERLFTAMQSGDPFGLTDVPWFDGGLFKTIEVPQLTAADLSALLAATVKDWRAIDPSIFGTLFERGLNPKASVKLVGAHYTDTATIDKLVRPLVFEPLLAEWNEARAKIQKLVGANTNRPNLKAATAIYQTFLLRLENYRVLDPACGSGNFLYLSLRALREVEKRARVEAAELGLQADLAMHTGPHNILGIEINEYAAELARVTVWIGDMQWSRQNGYPHAINPILQPLDGIENRDALLARHSRESGNPEVLEARWPEADVVVGNPPFIGDKVMRSELGDEYVDTLRRTFAGRVPGGADFVTYWFEKARAQIEAGKLKAAGLVATNSIRQKRNRVILERIIQTSRIFEAWADEPWVNDGAAVRVSLICFGNRDGAKLDGIKVDAIYPDLTGAGANDVGDLTKARTLVDNKDASFFGICLSGKFKVDTATALEWLKDNGNPNGRPNSDVVRPIYNGSDITRRWAGHWTVDFANREMSEAADYLKPFEWVEKEVRPVRMHNNDPDRVAHWWRHGRSRPALRAALTGQTRFIATPETAKHRFFVRFPVEVAPEHSLIVIPRGDAVMFGLLSSRIHCVWALAKGGRMGVGNDPRYNASLTFETFPFPPGFSAKGAGLPSGEQWTVIAEAAQSLETWRESWLNPSEWVEHEITPDEQAAGFPPRVRPKPEHAAAWKKRTLTNLYNENPTGLRLRQEALDAAVAAAYGWTDYTPETSDDEILRRLLKLNLERAKNLPRNSPADGESTPGETPNTSSFRA